MSSSEKQPMASCKAHLPRTTDKRHSIVAFIGTYQLHVSLAILASLALLYNIPSTHAFAQAFFVLLGGTPNPEDPSDTILDIHRDDRYFVALAVVAIIFVRIFCMDVLFKPFSRNVLAMGSANARQRFAEQGWAMISYSASFLWGFRILYGSLYFHNFDNLYRGFPHYMHRETKAYYLVEFANWASQLFILHIEKRRKDHYQMFAHHIITIFLVYGSYVRRFIRIGNVIMALMDFVDIWLSLAKVLKYCGFANLCDFTFLIFFFSWVALRHGLYNYLIYFTYTRVYELLGDALCPVDGSIRDNCISFPLTYAFLVLLVGLQIIMLIWMFLILKVLYKILTGSNAEDIRSDSEDEEEEQQEEKENERERMEEKKDHARGHA